jgi:hypothetical protein
MINAIKSEPDLAPFIECKSECFYYDGEKEYPYIDDAINDDSVVALVPDKYYNSLHLSKTPPSIDHLVTLARQENGFAHFLIEDKNTKRIDVKNVYNKFKTTLKDFMEKRFRHVFLDPKYPIHSIQLYLVTNPQKEQSKNGSQNWLTIGIKLLLGMNALEFGGKRYTIKNSDPKVLVKIQDVHK